MPRKNPLQAREKEICSRLREFRMQTKLSRVAFAQKAGIDSSVIVRYEHRRVPLKYIHAWRLMRTFFISAAWLATGDNGKWSRGSAIVPGPELIRVREDELFSEVYDKILSQPSHSNRAHKLPHELGPSELRARHEWSLQIWIRDRLIELPDSLVPDFIERIKQSGKVLLKQYPKDSAEEIESRKARYREDLDPEVRLRLLGTI